MSFPVNARYFIRFRHSDSGLTPSFTYFKRADTLASVTSPTIYEVGGGAYYFDFSFSSAASPDIVFEVDGGSSIPTEEVRYVSGTISPKDYFVDEPISQVKTDVWGDTATYGAGTKGLQLGYVGTPTDASSAATLFGKTLLYKESVRGDTAGASDGKSVKNIADLLGTPDISLSAQILGVITQVVAALGTTEDHLDQSIIAARNNVKGLGDKDLTQVDTNITNSMSGLDFTPVTDGIAALQTSVDTMQLAVTRILGLTKENSVMDQTAFVEGTSNLRQARLRLFSTAAEAAAAAAGGAGGSPIAIYQISATWQGQNIQTYAMTRIDA